MRYDDNSTEVVETYTPNFEAWISEFQEWQTRIGFDPTWLGDYTFDIKFDWDTAGDQIEFGDFEGMPKWERRMQIPQQNIRDAIISMVTVQGDTEFASVEQQNHLLDSAPTEYDRKSALRIMCEEQRHGWQMAYLLCTFFGEQGVREAMKLLERNSMANQNRNEEERGRLLGSFNEPIDHWLDFFCFTHFIDRDGKFQLKMLSTSSFKPLAASMGPMLKEESFHLGTGSNGLRRIIKAGVIPQDMLQRYMNKWVSTAHDLFGVDSSSSAHWAYVWGIKGRWDERKKQDAEIDVDKEVLNQEARGHYHDEIVREVNKLNGYQEEGATPFYVAHENFNRDIGDCKGMRYTVHGEEFEGTDDDWNEYIRTILPTAEDEEALKEYFKLEWIANKPLTARQLESGIGATA